MIAADRFHQPLSALKLLKAEAVFHVAVLA